jgi:hypothetical protein
MSVGFCILFIGLSTRRYIEQTPYPVRNKAVNQLGDFMTPFESTPGSREKVAPGQLLCRGCF